MEEVDRMITVDGVNNTNAIWGLSTDVKPTKANGHANVPNATLWITIDDTSKVFIYDKDGDRWCPVK